MANIHEISIHSPSVATKSNPLVRTPTLFHAHLLGRRLDADARLDLTPLSPSLSLPPPPRIFDQVVTMAGDDRPDELLPLPSTLVTGVVGPAARLRSPLGISLPALLIIVPDQAPCSSNQRLC